MNIVQLNELVDICKGLAKMCDDLDMLISITAYGDKDSLNKGYVSFSPYTGKGLKSLYVNVKENDTYVSLHDREDTTYYLPEDAVKIINGWKESKGR